MTSCRDAHFRSFEREVLPRLAREEIGVLGMKPLGSAEILKAGAGVTARDCWHYALTLPIATVITGMEKLQVLEDALEAVRTFKPLSEAEIAALLARTKEAALTGRYERFKTSTQYDSTAKHPEWLG